MDQTVIEALRLALERSKSNPMLRYLIEMALIEAIAPGQDAAPSKRRQVEHA